MKCHAKFPPSLLHPLVLALAAGFAIHGRAAEGGDAALSAVTVREAKSAAEKVLAPTTTESATRQEIADTVNAMDTEDAFKYLPNVLVRKRFIGDTDAPISSRTTGINASARSLVYADGVLLSALVNNNNGNGSPRWFMVAPEEIERIDAMYGPFSAAYPGNSYGLVASITTRMPTKLEGSVKATQAWQDFSLYGTKNVYGSQQLSATVGNRVGDFSFWLSANHLDSHSMPVSFGTIKSSGGAGAAAAGGFPDRDRTGANILVVNANSLTHTVQDNAKVKVAYDFTPSIQGAYTFGIWQNQADTKAQSYLTRNGVPYYGAAAGQVTIGGTNYKANDIATAFTPGRKDMEHQMHSLNFRDKSTGTFSWDMTFSQYEYVRHLERSGLTGTQGSGGGAVAYPTYPAIQGGGAGRILDMTGTGWTTFDASGTWRPQGTQGAHIVSFGTHFDHYKLVSPTYNTNNWISQGSNGTVFSDARGKTETKALWLQDVWRFAPAFKATIGGRYEWWRAFDGFNLVRTTSIAGWPATAITQPGREHSAFSPKFSVAWDAAADWQVTGSIGRAIRFPTAGELYTTALLAGVQQTANPNLKPEDVLTSELAIEHISERGRVRLSVFEENVQDAIISQNAIHPVTNTATSFTQNVDKTRQRGIELVAQRQDVLIRGLELSGSLTYVDARICSNPDYVATAPGATSVGKHTPYVPDWRATLVASYRPDDKWTYTLAGRYSGRMYATVDNTDINPHTFMGFERFFVADARIRYQVAKQWSASLGVDNLNNRKYFLYHPFPQRTAFAELKFDY